ncbi:hypothetical protein PI124_g3188 [Phytophthora idaei]|nr:hypothetical protein PI124_g3188 [Phytophthora idaei]
MRTEFGEVVQADACVVDGCTCEFLLGVDFMREHEANMDFKKNELCCTENGRMVVVPFRIFDKETGAKVATVRTVDWVEVVEILVTVEDGKKGVFIPTKQFGSGMLAATMTDVRNGKAWVRAINAGRDRVKLPSKKELGTWIPLDEEMEVLEVNGALETNKLMEWLNKLGDVNTPLENEEEVHIGTTDEDGRALVMKWLHEYRHVVASIGRRVAVNRSTGDGLRAGSDSSERDELAWLSAKSANNERNGAAQPVTTAGATNESPATGDEYTKEHMSKQPVTDDLQKEASRSTSEEPNTADDQSRSNTVEATSPAGPLTRVAKRRADDVRRQREGAQAAAECQSSVLSDVGTADHFSAVGDMTGGMETRTTATQDTRNEAERRGATRSYSSCCRSDG